MAPRMPRFSKKKLMRLVGNIDGFKKTTVCYVCKKKCRRTWDTIFIKDRFSFCDRDCILEYMIVRWRVYGYTHEEKNKEKS